MGVGRRVSRRGAALIALPLVAAVITGGVYIATAGTNNEIKACYEKQGGELRRVGKLSACKDNEVGLTWNERGPRGLPGTDGSIGPTGPQGPPGETPTPEPSPYDLGFTSMVINGTQINAFTSVAGCRRNFATHEYEECIVTSNVNSTVLEWFNSTINGGDAFRDVDFVIRNSQGDIVRWLRAQHSFLTSFEVPDGNAASAETLKRLKFSFAPGSLSTVDTNENPATGSTGGTAIREALFSVEVGGLPVSGESKIGPLRMTVPKSPDIEDEAGFMTYAPGAPVFDDLRLDLVPDEENEFMFEAWVAEQMEEPSPREVTISYRGGQASNVILTALISHAEPATDLSPFPLGGERHIYLKVAPVFTLS